MQRFSDFAKEDVLDGMKGHIDDVLNQEIELLDYRTRDSKVRSGEKYLTLQYRLNGKKYVLFSGSLVLMDQIERYASHLPFLVTIRRINNYFSFN